DSALHDVREHRIEHADEVVGVAETRVAGALALQDHHGDLGQEVERDVVERPAPDLLGERARVVPPVAARVADAQRLAHACAFYAAAAPSRKAASAVCAPSYTASVRTGTSGDRDRQRPP